MHTPEDLQLELQAKGAKFTPLELQLPENLPLEDWAAVGRQLCRADAVMKWWLGDWAAFGLRKYGQLKEFATANNLNYGSLRNAAYVSQAVPMSRRRDNVEWSKHAEIAPLPAREQTKWLVKIETEQLPTAELRRQIRAAGGDHDALKSDGPVLKFATKSLDDLIHWLTTQPAKFWTPDRKAAWRERLKPVVEFYESLG
jgi:hypothetical protein